MLKRVDIATLACAVGALALIGAGTWLLIGRGAAMLAVGGLIWLDLRESSREKPSG